jgi:two-component system, NarL family, nitrate/nitrite sensor histidine kinase NarX
VSWKLEGGAAAVNEAGRMRMTTYRLALELAEPAPNMTETRAVAAGFNHSLRLLASGDPSRPLLVPWSADSRARFADVQRGWQSLSAEWLAPGGPRSAPMARADAFVVQIDGFVAAIENDLARWTAILHAYQLSMMGLAIAGAVALMYAGYRVVLEPVARLRTGLAAVQQGQLQTRVAVKTVDEFGELSAGFNEMAQTLQSLYTDLESRVRDKTARLEVKQRRLTDLYEISRFLAEATNLDEVARGFSRHVRRVAGADAVAVRWSDAANRRYLLLAADNLPVDMTVGEHCLNTGSCHCGQPAADAAMRVIEIRDASAPMSHCHQAGFRTLVSIPVKLHDQLLGEIDLFFRQPRELPQGERELLDTLANHLAGAMESLRASALEREAAIAEERGLLARELHDSIAQSLAFLKIQVGMLRDAMQRRNEAAAQVVLGELDAGVRESMADVRELLLHFRTRTNEEEIQPALATTVSKFRHQTGLDAELQVEGHGLPLPADVQVQVLHIVQEALSNVRKHARASRVQVKVSSAPHWRFEVVDDGVGFDAAPRDANGTSVGLRIMQERAQRIGARVILQSTPGRGSSIVLDLAPTPSMAEPAHP